MEENKEAAAKSEENIVIIEKNIHRTNLRRLIDTLYLFVPIALAFAGCFLAEPFWHFLTNNNDVPQIFRFGCAVILFIISVTFVFIMTRKPTMRNRLRWDTALRTSFRNVHYVRRLMWKMCCLCLHRNRGSAC